MSSYRLNSRFNTSSLRSYPGSLPQNEQGATMVEFAISAIILFMLIIMGLDIVRFGYTSLTIHYVMAQTARYGVAGTLHNESGVLDTSTRTDQTKRGNSIRRYAVDLGEKFGVNLDPSNILICRAALVSTNSADLGKCPPGSNAPGFSKEFFQVSYDRDFVFFWRGLTYSQTISVLARNEPY